MLSVNGTDWVSVFTGDLPLVDVAWNGLQDFDAVFVAVAAAGTNRVRRSTELVAWSEVSVPARIWVSVAYSPDLGIFAAVSFDGYVMTSPDGNSWTELTPTITGIQWSEIIWGNGMFLAVASGPDLINNAAKVMRSTDGLTWTVSDSFGLSGVSMYHPETDQTYDVYPGPWRDVKWNGTRFIAVAQGTFSSLNPGVTPYSAQIMTSEDGINWTPRPTPTDVWGIQIGCGVAVNGNSAVVVGANMGTPMDVDGKLVMYSTDGGDSWTSVAPGIITHWRGVATGTSKFVAVGDPTNIYSNTDLVMTSPTAMTWTPRVAPALNHWTNIEFFSNYAPPEISWVGKYTTTQTNFTFTGAGSFGEMWVLGTYSVAGGGTRAWVGSLDGDVPIALQKKIGRTADSGDLEKLVAVEWFNSNRVVAGDMYHDTATGTKQLRPCVFALTSTMDTSYSPRFFAQRDLSSNPIGTGGVVAIDNVYTNQDMLAVASHYTDSLNSLGGGGAPFILLSMVDRFFSSATFSAYADTTVGTSVAIRPTCLIQYDAYWPWYTSGLLMAAKNDNGQAYLVKIDKLTTDIVWQKFITSNAYTGPVQTTITGIRHYADQSLNSFLICGVHHFTDHSIKQVFTCRISESDGSIVWTRAIEHDNAGYRDQLGDAPSLEVNDGRVYTLFHVPLTETAGSRSVLVSYDITDGSALSGIAVIENEKLDNVQVVGGGFGPSLILSGTQLNVKLPINNPVVWWPYTSYSGTTFNGAGGSVTFSQDTGFLAFWPVDYAQSLATSAANSTMVKINMAAQSPPLDFVMLSATNSPTIGNTPITSVHQKINLPVKAQE